MPKGWKFLVGPGDVARIAQIELDRLVKKGRITLDKKVFDDPNLPDGCKVFMFFHEIGHAIYGPKEHKCDEFAFFNSLRAGVSPFLCFIALAAFMPDHYAYRVEYLDALMNQNPYLIELTDGN